jgi:hypothetical protein
MARRSFAWLLASALVACTSGGSALTSLDAAIDFGPVPDAAPIDGLAFDGGSDGKSALCNGLPCQPEVLAEGTNPIGAGGLVVDATRVYWVDTAGGHVLACAKTGCDRSPTVLASGQDAPTGIALSGGTLFWTNHDGGTVVSCGVTGCGGKPTVVATGLSSPGGISADAANVYWGETGGGGSVKSCAVSGCASPTVLASAPGLELAVDTASVYFTDGTGVSLCPLAGCSGAPTLLFTVPGATGIALDTANVYVTSFVTATNPSGFFQGAVLQCAKSGCSGKPVALATTQGAPLPVAVSSGVVYWGNTLGGTDLWSCATVGCKGVPTAVATAALPLSLAVDDATLYWASLGAVLSLPK